MAKDAVNEREGMVDSILRARRYGVTLVTAALGVGVFLSEFQRIHELPFTFINYGYLTVLVFVVLLVFLWIWVTEDELVLMLKWVQTETYEPPSGLKETATIIAMGIFLVCLFFTAKNLLFFAVAFTAYSTAVLLAVRQMNRNELAVAFADSRKHFKRRQEQNPNEMDVVHRLRGLDVLEEYFLGRPHTIRHVIILACSALGVVLAIGWYLTQNGLLGTITYAFFATILLVSEVVINYWRLVRDSALRQVRQAMRQDGVTPP